MRLSHSQMQTWKQCKRWWYNNYILKLPNNSDMCYANAGNVVHKCLERYYNDKDTSIEPLFDQLWTKYKLDLSKLSNLKNKYYNMILFGIGLNVNVTNNELKIYYEDFVCYIDVFNSDTKIIADWKTSTRSKNNEREYIEQLKTYCWMVYRKYNWIPEKAIVYYLKNNTTLEYSPTLDDIKEHEQEINKIQNDIETEEVFPKCSDNPTQCPFFCPYKDVCFNTDKITFDLIIKNNLIYITGYKSDLLTEGLDRQCSYMVEGYDHMPKNTKWDGRMRLFNKRTYTVPIGFRNKLIRLLLDYCKYRKKPFVYSITNKDEHEFKPISNLPNSLCGITLRDYQITATETALKDKIGLLHISVGAGKTEIGAEIIRQLKTKTIWLTHKVELLNQTKERLKERLGVEIGIVQGDNIDIKDITVCMVQTLKNKPGLIKDLQDAGLLIVDEAHHAKSKSFNSVLKLIHAEHRIGLSGSITDKPDTMMIESQLGEVIYELQSNELIEKAYLAKPEIIITTIENEMVRGSWKEVQEEFIINNKIRNEKIQQICEKEKDRFTVIIVDRIEHGKLLQSMIPDSVFINGEVCKIDRVNIMLKARRNEIKVLIGTVISEGVDLPQMDNIIIAKGGGVSVIPTIQSAGRVLRLNKDMSVKRIYDFNDSGKYINRHSKERIKIYKDYNKDIIILEK